MFRYGHYRILVLLLIVILLTPSVIAQESEELNEEEQRCSNCHKDYMAAWQKGVHAIAYERQSFQDAWQAAANDPTCLGCHTTDFQPATGTYHYENIQCESCHGHTPAEHPPEVFVVKTNTEICGDCHVSTFEEWEHSLHAFNEDMGAVGCATCHNPHGQTLRFETVDELCLNCHQNNAENSQPYAETYIHVSHNEIEFESVDVTCSSCHMFNVGPDELHQLPDHTMKVETVPCTTCHETLAATGVSSTLIDIDTQLAEERDELKSQVMSLEDEVAVLRENQPGGVDYVQLTQGLIIGLGVAITLFFVLGRWNGKAPEAQNGRQ